MKLKTLILAAILMAAFVAPAYAQEIPAPGTKIDKNNYKKYAHLFPEEFLPVFTDGFNGLVSPIEVNVMAPTNIGFPKAFHEYSAKNKGKYSVDASGQIVPFFPREGLPFPDLQRNDKDFLVKFMWNFDNKYTHDDMHDTSKGGSYEKRRGEPVRWNTSEILSADFRNRMFAKQKPNLTNPINLFNTMLMHFVLPDSIKNTMLLTYRYVDSKKIDDTYMYLPSMRRVLRAEAGQRSTPVQGSVSATDDFGGFLGRIPEFTYTFVKEQKVLAIIDSRFTGQVARNWKKGELPFPYEGYQVRDVYVIDVKPKDPKYPQSRKRLWIDKESLMVPYAASWDRAGKLWKVWFNYLKTKTSPTGEKYIAMDGNFGADIQFGLANSYAADLIFNTNNYTYEDFIPSALLKMAN